MLEVGDKINVKGASVPMELEDKYFIVLDASNESIKLSEPYIDADCTKPWKPKRKNV